MASACLLNLLFKGVDDKLVFGEHGVGDFLFLLGFTFPRRKLLKTREEALEYLWRKLLKVNFLAL